MDVRRFRGFIVGLDAVSQPQDTSVAVVALIPRSLLGTADKCEASVAPTGSPSGYRSPHVDTLS